MRGKTGAARIALATGCPVIPVGAVGRAGPPGAVREEARPVPAQADHLPAGDPVDLDDLLAQPATSRGAHEATERIMAAITALVEEIRGEKAPAVRFDPTRHRHHRDRQPEQEEEEGQASMSKVAVFGAGSWGTAFSIVLSDAGNDVTIWGRREDVCATRSTRSARTPTTCRGSSSTAGSARPTTSRRHWPARRSWCWRCRRRRCAQNLEEWAPYIPSDAVLVSPDEGRRARHRSSG